MYGYNGKVLFVDLSASKLEIRDLPEEVVRNFIGGPGLGAYYLYREMPKNTDPFAPESVVVVTGGLCVGTGTFLPTGPLCATSLRYTGALTTATPAACFRQS